MGDSDDQVLLRTAIMCAVSSAARLAAAKEAWEGICHLRDVAFLLVQGGMGSGKASELVGALNDAFREIKPEDEDGAPPVSVDLADAERSLWSLALKRPRPPELVLVGPALETVLSELRRLRVVARDAMEDRAQYIRFADAWHLRSRGIATLRKQLDGMAAQLGKIERGVERDVVRKVGAAGEVYYVDSIGEAGCPLCGGKYDERGVVTKHDADCSNGVTVKPERREDAYTAREIRLMHERDAALTRAEEAEDAAGASAKPVGDRDVSPGNAPAMPKKDAADTVPELARVISEWRKDGRAFAYEAMIRTVIGSTWDAARVREWVVNELCYDLPPFVGERVVALVLHEQVAVRLVRAARAALAEMPAAETDCGCETCALFRQMRAQFEATIVMCERSAAP